MAIGSEQLSKGGCRTLTLIRPCLSEQLFERNLHTAEIEAEFQAHLFALQIQNDALGILELGGLYASCHGNTSLNGCICSCDVGWALEILGSAN